MSQYDFIAIGDTATDAFILIKDASVHCNINREKCEICMRFADKVPYEDVYVVPAVGNSANAAVSASRLGLRSALISNIGDDYFGEECLAALRAEKVATEYIRINKNIKTNYHYVLWYDDDRTILIKHEAYNYEIPDIGAEPKWVYFSSLAGNSLEFHKQAENYLVAHPSVKVAFQPGNFQIKMGIDNLKGLYKRTDVFICNKEEAQRILSVEESDVKILMKMLSDLGPKISVVTDGVKGAYAFDGQKYWFMPPYPDPKPPLERTGAGDAFSSAFVAFLCSGMSVLEALRGAPINSMSVVQHIGAREGLLYRGQIDEYLRNAPLDYQPKEI